MSSVFDPPELYRALYREDNSLWGWLQRPGVVIPVGLLLLTLIYQALHASPYAYSTTPPRHPGQLLWDLLVALIPAGLLYALGSQCHPPVLPSDDRSHAAKSAILMRLLGMDKPNGLINTVAHAGRKSFSFSRSSTLLKPAAHTPPGLGNYDNSCFQNSILQGLSSLRPLPPYLATAIDDGKSEQDKDAGSANTLRRLIARLTDPANNGNTLWTPKKLKSLDTWQQQDAQEYFSTLLDDIDKEVAVAARHQNKPRGLESASPRPESDDDRSSDDSGYQSLFSSKSGAEVRSLRNPLEGLVAQRVACVQCGYSEGLSMIPFNCLTLSFGMGQMGQDLFEQLDSYTALEAIDGVECPKCSLLKLQRLLKLLVSRSKDSGASDDQLQEPLARLEAVDLALEEDDFEDRTLSEKCKLASQHKVTTTKTKQVVIARPPQSLAIHMNRSVFDVRTGDMFKNLSAVQFPRTLDLGPWCLGSAGGSAPEAANLSAAGEEEQWFADPRSSMVSGDAKPSKITGPIYELRSVITHQGRHENGHYVCYRKHPQQPPCLDETLDPAAGKDYGEEGGQSKFAGDADPADAVSNSATVNDPELDKEKWWRLSDESVWEVSEDQVLAQGGVFMLFYDCVDPNSVFVSELDAADEAFHETSTETPQTVVLQPEDLDSISARESPLSPILRPGESVDRTIPLAWPMK